MKPSAFRYSLLLVFCFGIAVPGVLAQQAVGESTSAIPLIIHAEQGDREHPWFITSSKEAYVVAFHVIPEIASISLVYPNSLQQEPQMSAGELRVLADAMSNRMYTVSKKGESSGLLNRSTHRSRGETDYLLVLASEQPFTFSPLDVKPRDFRRRLSMSAFTIDPYVEHIARQMVPEGQAFRTRLLRF